MDTSRKKIYFLICVAFLVQSSVGWRVESEDHSEDHGKRFNRADNKQLGFFSSGETTTTPEPVEEELDLNPLPQIPIRNKYPIVPPPIETNKTLAAASKEPEQSLLQEPELVLQTDTTTPIANKIPAAQIQDQDQRPLLEPKPVLQTPVHSSPPIVLPPVQQPNTIPALGVKQSVQKPLPLAQPQPIHSTQVGSKPFPIAAVPIGPSVATKPLPLPVYWTVAEPRPTYQMVLTSEQGGPHRVYRTSTGRRVALVDVDKVETLDKVRDAKCFSLFGSDSNDDEKEKPTPMEGMPPQKEISGSSFTVDQPGVVINPQYQTPPFPGSQYPPPQYQTPYFRPNEYGASTVSFPTRQVSMKRYGLPVPMVGGGRLRRLHPVKFRALPRINLKPLIQENDPGSGSKSPAFAKMTFESPSLPQIPPEPQHSEIKPESEKKERQAGGLLPPQEILLSSPVKTVPGDQAQGSGLPLTGVKKLTDGKGRFFWTSYYDDYYDEYYDEDYYSYSYPHPHHNYQSYWSQPYSYFKSLIGGKKQ